MEVATLASRFLLAFMFILAGISKLRDRQLPRVIASYELLPKALVRPLSGWLPRLEIACGVLLGLGLATAVTALIVAALLVGFAGALALMLLRGRKIDCGCFGSAARTSVSPLMWQGAPIFPGLMWPVHRENLRAVAAAVQLTVPH